ncbi:MAG: hypothetical protein ACI35O_09080 [Bacillaceae bacterium]
MNSVLNNLELYNEEVKRRYLEKFDEPSALTIGYVLSKATSTESVLKRDLAQFNDEEISLVMHNINPVNLRSSKRYGGIIKSYIDWAMANGYGTGSNINVLAGMSDDFYKDFVGVKKTNINKDELQEILSEIVNDQDKLPIALAFEGVAGEDLHEQRYLTIDCIKDDNILEIPTFEGETRTVEVSSELIDLIKKTDEQTVYQFKNGKTTAKNKDSELNNSDYVLKKPARGGSFENEPIAKSVLYSRLRIVSEDTGYPQLTYKNIQQSGMIYMAYEIFKETGQLTDNDYRDIAKRFNYKKSKGVNGKYYYNLTSIKYIANRDSILELYGVDIENK